MKLGVFTPVYGSLSTPEMIAKVQSLRHVKAIELGTGGWPGRAHLDDINEMIDGECRATTFRKMVEDAGLTISALSCHGNPLHPDAAIARANFDPSHLFWQGVDIPSAVRALGDCIFHVHAKDVAFDRQNVAVNGVLDAKSYRHMRERSWLFRTVGWGHGETV